MADETKVQGVFKKLFEIQNMNLKFKKNAKGGFGSYVTYDSIMEIMSPILEKKKLLITHQTIVTEHGGYAVQTSLVDIEDGSSISSKFPLKDDLEPQKAGGAITYGKRYNVGEVFDMIIDVDDDGSGSSPKNVKAGKDSGSFSL